MPTYCDPWPGKTKAWTRGVSAGEVSVIVISWCLLEPVEYSRGAARGRPRRLLGVDLTIDLLTEVRHLANDGQVRAGAAGEGRSLGVKEPERL
jgi:hypothetical protein